MELTKALHESYSQMKSELNVVDFNDLEQKTLRVLNDDEARARLLGEYDHIFVDEFQDVSAVQDAIVRKLHEGNSTLFMVGDVKQSIYRFRLADPQLFMDKVRDFSVEEGAEERKIFLTQNFRSSEKVL